MSQVAYAELVGTRNEPTSGESDEKTSGRGVLKVLTLLPFRKGSLRRDLSTVVTSTTIGEPLAASEAVDAVDAALTLGLAATTAVETPGTVDRRNLSRWLPLPRGLANAILAESAEVNPIEPVISPEQQDH